MKTDRFLFWSSLVATLLIGLACIFALGEYHYFIHRPRQGGWDAYRIREFGLQLGPYFVLFISLLISRASRVSRGWRYLAGAGLVISAPYALLFSGVFVVVIASALVLHFLYVRNCSVASGAPYLRP